MSPEPTEPATRDGAAQAEGTGLEPFRRRLDFLDGEIARLLGERFEVCREVAHHKREYDIPMMQPERVIEVRERYLARGAEVDLPAAVHSRAVRAVDRGYVRDGGRTDSQPRPSAPAGARTRITGF